MLAVISHNQLWLSAEVLLLLGKNQQNQSFWNFETLQNISQGGGEANEVYRMFIRVK